MVTKGPLDDQGLSEVKQEVTHARYPCWKDFAQASLIHGKGHAWDLAATNGPMLRRSTCWCSKTSHAKHKQLAVAWQSASCTCTTHA